MPPPGCRSGEVLAHAGDPEGAIGEIRTALELDPFTIPSWRAAYGRSLVLTGRLEEAMVELRWCAARLPDYAPCFASMVVACCETGRLDEASAALREHRRIRPDWRPGNFDGSWFFHREQDAERFEQAFRAAANHAAGEAAQERSA